MITTHTAEDVKTHAAVSTLKSVDFLRSDGAWARPRRTYRLVRYIFQDGKQFVLTKAEVTKLDALRKSQDDA